MSGRLITMEGLDGSGKATQTTLLFEALQKRLGSVRRVSFPDYGEPSSALVKMYLGGAFGENPISVNPYAASSFYAVDRFASFQRFWKEDYESGKLILADRYSTSNIVYHMGKLPRADWDSFLDWVREYEYGKLGLPQPDATILLDMPAEVSRTLLTKRYEGDESKKDIHERDGVYLVSCRESAAYAAKKLGWYVIKCAESENPKPIEQIHCEILQSLSPLLEG